MLVELLLTRTYRALPRGYTVGESDSGQKMLRSVALEIFGNILISTASVAGLVYF